MKKLSATLGVCMALTVIPEVSAAPWFGKSKALKEENAMLKSDYATLKNKYNTLEEKYASMQEEFAGRLAALEAKTNQ